MKKVLILGSGGMAGHVLTLGLRAEPEKYDVHDVARADNPISPRYKMDVTDFKALQQLIEEVKPDFIVNCVGLLNQYAEEHPDQAILLNSYLPHFLEAETKDSATKVLHISTDCVFSGDRGGYIESDLKDGRGFYAQSKALGEINNDKDLTIRTSIIGPEIKSTGIGLFHWFAQQEGNISGFKKAIWTGVTVIELMKAIKAAMTQDIKGLVHLVNGEIISKYDLLLLFKKHFNAEHIKVDEETSFESDKSVVRTNFDFKYEVASYDQMVKEMQEWIVRYPDLYQPLYGGLM